MKTLYETSDWGWDEAAKQEQLFEDEARYILAVDSSPHIVGFLHFRFVIENDQAVIYCYEIQVESQHRGQGLGQHLMHIMELIGTEWKMKKAMLTVFKRPLLFIVCIILFRQQKSSAFLSSKDKLHYG
eukprot:Sdes_comp18211_c0_seq4m7779